MGVPVLVVVSTARVDLDEAGAPLDEATGGADVPVTVELLGERTDGAVVRTALAVRVPVAVGLTARTYPLALTVAGASGEAVLTVDAIGLPELVIADGPAPADGRYSSIVLPTAIAARLTGAAPLRLEATGDITLAGAADLGADDLGPKPIFSTVCEGDIKGLLTSVLLQQIRPEVGPIFGDLKYLSLIHISEPTRPY